MKKIKLKTLRLSKERITLTRRPHLHAVKVGQRREFKWIYRRLTGLRLITQIGLGFDRTVNDEREYVRVLSTFNFSYLELNGHETILLLSIYKYFTNSFYCLTDSIFHFSLPALQCMQPSSDSCTRD